MEKINIVIAEDHTMIRQVWGYILNNDGRFQVVAECGSGEEAIALTKQFHPDLVIMDINLPGIDGITATQLIRKAVPETKVLGVSLHTEPIYARKMFEKGAMGYVTKNSSKEEMIAAILEIKNGGRYVCQETKDILSHYIIQGKEPQSLLDSLSEREKEIIKLIRKGNTSKEIAIALNISAKTVEVHRYNILKKLDLKNTVALLNLMNKFKFDMNS